MGAWLANIRDIGPGPVFLSLCRGSGRIHHCREKAVDRGKFTESQRTMTSENILPSQTSRLLSRVTMGDFLFLILFIYLAMPDLSGSLRDLVP